MVPAIISYFQDQSGKPSKEMEFSLMLDGDCGWHVLLKKSAGKSPF